MFRWVGLCCLSVCLLSAQLVVAAADAPVAVQAKPRAVAVRQFGRQGTISGIRNDADPNDPKERLLVLTPGGPIVVEATILLDGKPFRMAREQLVAKLIQAADTDGDGKPTWKEALANPRFGFGRFAYSIRNASQLKATVKRYDRNQNSIVDIEEARYLIAWLGGGAAFNVTHRATIVSQPDLKNILDGDGDGVISPQELAATADILKSRDANDNDLLEAGEAGGGTVQYRYRNLQTVGRGSNSRPAATSYLLGPTANLVAIFTAFEAKYGGADKAIQPGDFRWLPELVTQLDLDKNGTLDAGEMVGLHRVSPHLVVEVNLGKHDEQPWGIRLVSIAKVLGNLDRVSEKFVEQIILERPGMKLTLAASSHAKPSTANYARSAKAMLTRYDGNKNGYIEKEELEQAAAKNQKYLVAQFDRWDANGDGMVYPKEIEAAYLEQLAPRFTAVTALSSYRGPSFFNAIDETGDNRISLREMQIAARRLATFDTNGDGQLGVDEMPVEMAVTFSRGPNAYYRGGGRAIFGGIRRPGTGTATAASRGPNWFVRMDKNGDGDLTPREFLGSDEKFQQLDTNADGFIERKEAKIGRTN